LSFLAFKGKHNPLTFSLNIKYLYGSKVADSINTNRLFNEQNFKNTMVELFDKIDIHRSHDIVQVNLGLSNFEETKYVTMDMINYEDDKKQLKITNSMQKLRDKFGVDIIKNATEF
jgi:DNA polymerase-4